MRTLLSFSSLFYDQNMEFLKKYLPFLRKEKQPKKILIVDDLPVLRDTLSSILKKDGHSVDCCGNGAEALNTLNDNDYDLMITDIMMPECNGLDLVKAIHKDHMRNTSHMGIIAISGGENTVTPMSKLGLIKNQVDLTMQKPFSTRALLKATEETLDKVHNGKNLTAQLAGH